MRSRRLVTSLAALGFVSAALLPASAGAQDRYNVHFRSAQVTGQAGQPITIPIAIDNQPGAVTALSLGVKHAANFLTLQRVDLGPALQSLVGSTPDERFYSLDLNPAGGTGFTFAVILGRDSSAAVAIPAGLDQHILSPRYQIAAAAAGTTQVQITEDLGSPKVKTILDVKGVAKTPTATPAPITTTTLTITEGPAPFLRGDTNQSGKLDISDAILILDYLFQGSRLPAGAPTRDGCAVAMNVDGSTGDGTPDVEDERDINATDAIVLLRYIFPIAASPPAPAAPFPQCGPSPNPIDAGITCTTFQCR